MNDVRGYLLVGRMDTVMGGTRGVIVALGTRRESIGESRGPSNNQGRYRGHPQAPTETQWGYQDAP